MPVPSPLEGAGLGERGTKSLPLHQVADIGRKLADSLAYAHSQGVVHHDVKPANMLLDAHGEPHLLDFGLAVRAVPEAAEASTAMGPAQGTAAYMAPEQWVKWGEVASDQYSLGCTLYELSTGQTPFAGGRTHQMFLHCSQPVPPPRSVRPDIPKDLNAIILKCLEKEPASRYASCAALADDLRRFANGEPVTVRRPAPVERFTRWAKRNKRLAGMGALVLLTMALGTGFSLGFGLYANEQADQAPTQKGKAEEKTEELKRQNDRRQQALARAVVGRFRPLPRTSRSTPTRPTPGGSWRRFATTRSGWRCCGRRVRRRGAHSSSAAGRSSSTTPWSGWIPPGGGRRTTT